MLSLEREPAVGVIPEQLLDAPLGIYRQIEFCACALAAAQDRDVRPAEPAVVG
jgi:hypothetical protein